jgi:hypothetical protein
MLLAFILYADTFLSILHVSVFLDRCYKTVYYVIREVEAAIEWSASLLQVQICDLGWFCPF